MTPVKQTTTQNVCARIIWSIKTTRSAVSKNRGSAVLFLALPSAKLWKHDFSSASERAFPGVFGGFFFAELPYKRGCFNTQEFTCSCQLMSSQRRVTRSDLSFQTKYPSIWSLLSWHPIHRHLWVRLPVFLKLFVSTVTVPPIDLDYVNRSASLQQFRLIYQRRARRLRSNQDGQQYQALDRFILREVLACRRRQVRLNTKHAVGREHIDDGGGFSVNICKLSVRQSGPLAVFWF